MTHQGNGKMLFVTLLFPVLYQFLKIPLLCFHLPFPCSALQFSKKQPICNHNIIAHLITDLFHYYYYFSDYLYLSYFKVLFS